MASPEALKVPPVSNSKINMSNKASLMCVKKL